MTDSPLTGPVHQPGTGAGAPHLTARRSRTTRSPTNLALRPEQHPPAGVDVKDLQPLRGRPCGPILDPNASTRRAQRQAEHSQKKDQEQESGVDRPRSFRNDKHYGMYLAVARSVLLDPRYGRDCTAPSPQRTET